MGLETKVQLDNGVEVKYFKVSKGFNFDADNKVAQFFLIGFKDLESKKSNFKPVISIGVEIKNEQEGVVTKRPLTLEEIKIALPLERQIKFVGEGENKLQVNLSNEELLEAGKDLTANVTTQKEVNYFDDFETHFEGGNYLTGFYGFLKAHPKYKEFLGKTKDV